MIFSSYPQFRHSLLVVHDDRVLLRFCSFFGDERTLRISHFSVYRAPNSDGSGVFLRLRLNSIVERPVLQLPRHCFNIVTIPQVAAGYTDGCGLFGIVYCLSTSIGFSLCSQLKCILIGNKCALFPSPSLC